MKWCSVPICDDCWAVHCWIVGEEKVPVRLKEPEDEICHACGKPTHSGIYVRREVEIT